MPTQLHKLLRITHLSLYISGHLPVGGRGGVLQAAPEVLVGNAELSRHLSAPCRRGQRITVTHVHSQN